MIVEETENINNETTQSLSLMPTTVGIHQRSSVVRSTVVGIWGQDVPQASPFNNHDIAGTAASVPITDPRTSLAQPGYQNTHLQGDTYSQTHRQDIVSCSQTTQSLSPVPVAVGDFGSSVVFSTAAGTVG